MVDFAKITNMFTQRINNNYSVVISPSLAGLRRRTDSILYFDPINIIHNKYDWLNNELSKTFYGYIIGYDQPTVDYAEIPLIVERLIEYFNKNP